MEIKFQIFEDEHLLIQKFIGVFSLDYYLRYTQHIGKTLAAGTITKVLIDFRDLKFSESAKVMPPDFEEKLNTMTSIRKKIHDNELKGQKATLVIWVDKPLPTVIAQLFINNFSHMNYNVCSTETKAADILTISTTFSLSTHTSDLANTFD